MNFQAAPAGSLSLPEMTVLAILVLICALAAWAFYQRWRGGTSDVSGLKLGTRGDRAEP